ncbi:UDP-glycosyltransferase 75C1-like [Punica granatum]|uniref:Glycosyltransferase n=2 Tax=Punica granatum TaxID=22663 RepID=A0A218XG81_PUNGR|nr:UDP-glycosyltransferase 75C1-like [Punica granatum]OWM84235.1 hypothetical protein CDL15_Pgr011620 [Punica granatum]PKI61151.1 hypothetical protein CRG98_018471 [Punica granatum]
MATPYCHFLIVSFPSQGLINPSLQFAKRLLRLGAHVTFATSISANRQMRKSTETIEGLSYIGFSDGFDDGSDMGAHDLEQFMAELKRHGSDTLRQLIENNLKEGREFTHVFYTTIVPWVADVASFLRLPSTLIWAQPATVLDIYYYYFSGYGDAIANARADHSSPIQLTGLPPLTGRDIPSFFTPGNHYNFSLPLMKRHLEILDEQRDHNPKVLVNTFDALEEGPLRAIDKLNMVAIGPLLPSAFLDGHDPSDTSFGGDLFRDSRNYIEWLNTKPKASVIYVSFGSISVLSKQQKDEMARGLTASSRPFLWVIRKSGEEGKEDDEELIGREDLERQGMIVPWCSQVEVLSHPSVGCFVTHCGWNSTFESLACGVPVVAFPQWTDQHTNAKLVEDVWKTGVRVEMKDGIVKGEEIRRCLDLVVGGGEKGEEMRRNANKWKDLAREAAREGGSSDKNLRAFLDEITVPAANLIFPAI